MLVPEFLKLLPCPPPAHANPWHGRLRSSSCRNIGATAVVYYPHLPPAPCPPPPVPEAAQPPSWVPFLRSARRIRIMPLTVGGSSAAAPGTSSGPHYSSLLAGINRLKDEQKALKAERKRVAKELNNQEKKRSRLRSKAKQLTDEDLLVVLNLRAVAKADLAHSSLGLSSASTTPMSSAGSSGGKQAASPQCGLSAEPAAAEAAEESSWLWDWTFERMKSVHTFISAFTGAGGEEERVNVFVGHKDTATPCRLVGSDNSCHATMKSGIRCGWMVLTRRDMVISEDEPAASSCYPDMIWWAQRMNPPPPRGRCHWAEWEGKGRPCTC